MLYYTEVDGQQTKFEVYTDTHGAVHVGLPDGRDLIVDVQTVLGTELYSLLIDGQSHEIHVEGGKGGEYEITLDNHIYSVKVETERQHRIAALAPRNNAQTGEVQIKAPMPGLVTIVAVEVGQTVEQGQRVAILEAMKMENELRAPKAGTIKAVSVQPGQTVEQNKVLVILE